MLLAVGFLGCTLLLCVVGIIVLALRSLNVPDVLQNIAVGSLTGLVGLLAMPQKSPPPGP